jgi:L-threonylcarbamoyladenylate synthase
MSNANFKLEEIKDAFLSGRLLALPTETVYGLAAPFNDLKLVRQIFKLKKRPLFDPLIVHVSSIDMAKKLVSVWPKEADDLAKKFWPGPLTLVLPKNNTVDDIVTAGQSTVAVRCPNHQLALKIISGIGTPLVAPSANPYQALSPSSISQVKEYFSADDVLFIDGGDCSVGIESTIVGLDSNKKIFSVLRKGILSAKEIGSVLTGFNEVAAKEYLNVTAHIPGGDDKHYRPLLPLIVVSDELKTDAEVQKKFLLDKEVTFESVSLNLDPLLAARELYRVLYLAGARAKNKNSTNLDHYIVLRLNIALGKSESWSAVMDRITRAASLIDPAFKI